MNVSRRVTKISRILLSTCLSGAVILTATAPYANPQKYTASATMGIRLVIHPKLETRTADRVPISYNRRFKTTYAASEGIPLCIRSNGISRYTVTASGREGRGFNLRQGEHWRPYQVMLQPTPSQRSQPLDNGQPSTALTPLSNGQDCEQGARLTLQMADSPGTAQQLAGAMNLTISVD